MKRLYHSARNFLNFCLNYFWLKRAGIENPGRVKINGRLFIRNYGGKITLGKNVKINSAFWANPIGGDDRTTIIVGRGAELTIGDNVGLSNSTIICHARVTLADGVRIGGDTRIYDTDFHSLRPEQRLSTDDSRYAKRAPVLIGRGAFIGAGCLLLRGSEVGENSVLGAGSVLRGKVPPNEIWFGNPALPHKSFKIAGTTE